jgi:hypothetical protein
MSQFVETPTKAFPNNAAIDPHLRVALSGGYLAAAGASTVELGTMERRSLAADEYGTVRLRTAQGTRKMVASGSITKGNPVYAAASGKIASSGTVYCGTALEASATDGDVIEVLPGPNTDISTASAGTTNSSFEVDNDASTPKIGFKSQTGGTGDFTSWLKPESNLSGDAEMILPEADGDTLAALALAQTLTNKTLGLGSRFTVDSVAAAGSAQGDAGALTADAVNIVTAGDGTKGVVLPTAVAGSFVLVYHSVATQPLPVYPASGDDINDGTTNVAVDLEGKTFGLFVAVDDTTWAAMYTANS